MRRRLEGLPWWVVDAFVAAAVAAVSAYALWVGIEAGARTPDALAYGLGLAAAGVLLARRRWPVAVLLLTIGISSVFYSLGYAGGTLQPAVFSALYSAAAAGRRWWSLAVLGGFAAMSVTFRVRVEGEDLFGRGVGLDVGLMVASWALGVAAYHRCGWTAEVAERLRRAEADREMEAQRRVAEERLRIARELHDVMAHTIAVIAVQAGVAADVLDDSPGAARAALETIREASREAHDELRATIGLLRDADRAGAPRAPAPGLDQLTGLVDMANGAGVRVELGVHGQARPLPAAVDLTAYRIVQESLTNVVRHAQATRASVAISYEPGAVRIAVDDDGRGADRATANGHGLTGMRERAEAVGGWLEAGPGHDRGFRVRARLPTERAHP
ncbi:MAG: sensor histidine kinase [Egibacteraceae bacterium]